MESIIINQKKMICELFMAFSTGREINGRIVQPCISNDSFIWQIHPEGYYEGDMKRNPNDKTIEYKISRDENICFRASANDAAIEFSRHWYIFTASQQVKRNTDSLIFTNWYISKDEPEMDLKEETLSYYVLIDINGYRKQDDFAIGYYNFSLKDWCLKGLDDNRRIDKDHMKWTYLPIDKD
jgi:hypothetical protein